MPLVFDSENLPPRPTARLFYGTFDSEELPPAPPPGLDPTSTQEIVPTPPILRGATVEGLPVPSTTPEAPPTPNPALEPFARTGGPDGDMSVVNEHAEPFIFGQGFRFAFEMPPNPPETPVHPPTAPPCGPIT